MKKSLKNLPTGKKRVWRAVQANQTRFFVPDLSPMARPQLAGASVRYVFVAESPHISEVEPENPEERRPLCGAAGRAWWKMVGWILEKDLSGDTSLQRLLQICARYQIAVLNAVQFPLDPKITRIYPDADPLKNLGFSKEPGRAHYKNASDPIILPALASLSGRLAHPSLRNAPVYCLGNDAQWFLLRSQKAFPERRTDALDKIPHPSAWWRRGGYFKQVAQDKLTRIFRAKPESPASKQIAPRRPVTE